jgi:membrane protease YdiL (CAAX protease family)
LKKSILPFWVLNRKNRIIDLATGFLLAAFCCTVYNIMTTAFANNCWTLNKQSTGQTILRGSWWILISVLYEELIFRGVLLYIAIKKIGLNKACILSAGCFGIYHWFSYNVLGDPLPMIIIFFMTGIFGLMLAFAFAKTMSLYLPIALHFGWNLFSTVVFSNGPLGQQIFIKTNANQPQGTLSWLIFLFQVFALPAFTFWYLKMFKKDATIT